MTGGASLLIASLSVIPSAEAVRRAPWEAGQPNKPPVTQNQSQTYHRRLSIETLNNLADGTYEVENADSDSSNAPGQPSQSTRIHRNAANANPDSHLVTSLPLLPDGSFPSRHWAGHLPAAGDGSDKKLFYWLFEPHSSSGDLSGDDSVPLILWLNGGPGCSSMDGLWLENGPFRLTPKSGEWTIDVNPFSWHNAPAWTLYVDQPVGTGLSYTKNKNYCKSDFEVNRDFHYFLEEFFLFHSDKFLDNSGKNVRRPFYFSGESHAGHYIPSMMDFILQRNDNSVPKKDASKLTPLRVTIPLSGAAIGNGWIDPYRQYSAADAAYGAGLIGVSQRAALEDQERQCQSNLKSGNYYSNVCFRLLDDVVAQSHGLSGDSVVSQYDTRLWESKGAARSFPFGHKDVETYLGGAASHTNPKLKVDYREVLKAIHAEESIAAKQTYMECTDPPYLALSHQDGLGVVDELVRILEHQSTPHMLFFNGINDLICNHVGNEKLLDALPWSNGAKYKLQQRYAWDARVDPSTKINYIEGRPDGFVKQFDNLTFLKILEAGHMVPMDQPSVSLAMIQTLIYENGNKGFLSSSQNLDRADSMKNANMCLLDECPNCPLVSEQDSGASESAGSANSSSSGSPLSILDSSPVSPKSIMMLLGSFVAGVLLSCLFLRGGRSKREQRELISAGSNDLELSDVDVSYRDRVDDAEYT